MRVQLIHVPQWRQRCMLHCSVSHKPDKTIFHASLDACLCQKIRHKPISRRCMHDWVAVVGATRLVASRPTRISSRLGTHPTRSLSADRGAAHREVLGLTRLFDSEASARTPASVKPPSGTNGNGPQSRRFRSMPHRESSTTRGCLQATHTSQRLRRLSHDASYVNYLEVRPRRIEVDGSLFDARKLTFSSAPSEANVCAGWTVLRAERHTETFFVSPWSSR